MITTIKEAILIHDKYKEKKARNIKDVFDIKCNRCYKEKTITFNNLSASIHRDTLLCRGCLCADTMFNRHGVHNSFQLESAKNKAAETCISRYGYSNAMKNKDIVKKTQDTNMKRYGEKYASKTNATKEKQKQSNILFYGDISPILNKAIIEKSCNTCNKNHNVDFYTKTSIPSNIRGNIIFNKSKDGLLEICKANNLTLLDCYNGSYNNKPIYYKFKCNKCGRIIKRTPHNRKHILCTLCHPFLSGISSQEKEIASFIRSIYNGPLIENTRSIISPKELDIYLPELKLAIEFDGLYWHSNTISDKHLLCKQKDLRLIRVFESDWLYSKEKIKSILSNIINNSNFTKIFARTCAIVDVANVSYNTFCKENHIQNSASASVKIGLMHNNELVQIMSFSKARLNNNYEWEMVRECSKLYTLIVGGKNRLLKYFEKKYKPKSILSYCDKRLFSGASYIKSGFILLRESKQNYWYFKNGKHILYNRQQFQKHKLSKLLNKFDSKLTEFVNMKNNGYNRIYDDGNLVYIKEYTYDNI